MPVLRHRLTALRQLWKALDGRTARTPADGLIAPPEAAGAVRDIPWDTITRILDAMPDHARPVKGQEGRHGHSQTRAKRDTMRRIRLAVWLVVAGPASQRACVSAEICTRFSDTHRS